MHLLWQRYIVECCCSLSATRLASVGNGNLDDLDALSDGGTALCTPAYTGDVLKNNVWAIKNVAWAIRNIPWAIRNQPWAIRTLPGTGVNATGGGCDCSTNFKEGSHINGVFCNPTTMEVEAMYVLLPFSF